MKNIKRKNLFLFSLLTMVIISFIVVLKATWTQVNACDTNFPNPDVCTNSSILVDYICKNNETVTTYKKCENGCSNQTCNSATSIILNAGIPVWCLATWHILTCDSPITNLSGDCSFISNTSIWLTDSILQGTCWIMIGWLSTNVNLYRDIILEGNYNLYSFNNTNNINNMNNLTGSYDSDLTPITNTTPPACSSTDELISPIICPSTTATGFKLNDTKYLVQSGNAWDNNYYLYNHLTNGSWSPEHLKTSPLGSNTANFNEAIWSNVFYIKYNLGSIFTASSQSSLLDILTPSVFADTHPTGVLGISFWRLENNIISKVSNNIDWIQSFVSVNHTTGIYEMRIYIDPTSHEWTSLLGDNAPHFWRVEDIINNRSSSWMTLAKDKIELDSSFKITNYGPVEDHLKSFNDLYDGQIGNAFENKSDFMPDNIDATFMFDNRIFFRNGLELFYTLQSWGWPEGYSLINHQCQGLQLNVLDEKKNNVESDVLYQGFRGGAKITDFYDRDIENIEWTTLIPGVVSWSSNDIKFSINDDLDMNTFTIQANVIFHNPDNDWVDPAYHIQGQSCLLSVELPFNSSFIITPNKINVY